MHYLRSLIPIKIDPKMVAKNIKSLHVVYVTVWADDWIVSENER